MIESGFDTGARSRVGAGGVWQFMPGAARAYGLEVSYWLDARCDPEQSADAAARYLKDLYVRFGSWPLVFAAYNAGYGAVLEVDHGATTRTTSGSSCATRRGCRGSRASTCRRSWRPRSWARTPRRSGSATSRPTPPYAYETVEAPPGTALATVARAAGAQHRGARGAQPRSSCAIACRPIAGRRACGCRRARRAAFARGFEAARAASDRMETIVLRFGETLDDVARARGIDARELRRLNGVKDSSGAARGRQHRRAAARRDGQRDEGARQVPRPADGGGDAVTTTAPRAGRRRRRYRDRRRPGSLVRLRGPRARLLPDARRRRARGDCRDVRRARRRAHGVEQPRRDGEAAPAAWCCRSSCARTSIPWACCCSTRARCAS